MKKNLLYIMLSALMGGAMTSCDSWVGDTEPSVLPHLRASME